jgi:hypothetical protein
MEGAGTDCFDSHARANISIHERIIEYNDLAQLSIPRAILEHGVGRRPACTVDHDVRRRRRARAMMFIDESGIAARKRPDNCRKRGFAPAILCMPKVIRAKGDVCPGCYGVKLSDILEKRQMIQHVSSHDRNLKNCIQVRYRTWS